MRVRLLTDYILDVEMWVAYPADPRFTYHDAGEILHLNDEHADWLIGEGKAVELSPGEDEEGIASA